MSRSFISITAVLILAVSVWTGCSTVPITGRSQLNLISPGQELQLGLSSFNQLKQEMPVSKDAALNALVQKVGQRIAAAAAEHLPNAQWEFVVFENPEPNAFCLPGGKIGIHTGILPITQDEAGLATVMGHEVAHASAHHGAERMSEALLMQAGGVVLSASLREEDPKVQTAAILAYGLGTQLGRVLPHSRRNESEADEMGLIYMARAGYDPEAALEFWKRFGEATKGSEGTPAFLRTHPVTEDRIQNIQRLLPRAKAEYRPAQ